MPLYEYHCSSCDSNFEELVSSTQETNPACPICHSNKTKKRLSTFAKPMSSAGAEPGGCTTGSCGLPVSPCAGGMCGLN